MKSEKRTLQFFSGPALFVAVVALLLIKVSGQIQNGLWLCGLILAILLACLVVYLTFKEMISQTKELQGAIAKKDKEAQDLRAVLDETHGLYREKVSKLESNLFELEKEKVDTLHGKERAMKELADQLNYYKNRAHAFEVSLEEALAELRSLSHLHYMKREEEVPKNLVKQHQQLREQFEEKSLILDQTRRRLFEAESFLIALKKQRGLELLDQNQEQEQLIKMIDELICENEFLESEIQSLETLVTIKLTSPKKTQKKLQEILEFQFGPISTKE